VAKALASAILVLNSQLSRTRPKDMTITQTLIEEIERDLDGFHRSQMSKRIAANTRELVEVEDRADPDKAHIARLRAAINRDRAAMLTPEVTQREVLAPLRKEASVEILAADVRALKSQVSKLTAEVLKLTRQVSRSRSRTAKRFATQEITGDSGSPLPQGYALFDPYEQGNTLTLMHERGLSGALHRAIVDATGPKAYGGYGVETVREVHGVLLIEPSETKKQTTTKRSRLTARK
jgi:hypothetical protein